MLDNLLQSGFRDLRRSLGIIIQVGLVGALAGFLLTELFGLILDKLAGANLRSFCRPGFSCDAWLCRLDHQRRRHYDTGTSLSDS